MSASGGGPLPPARSSIEVPGTSAHAFEAFTAGLNLWWPLATYSIRGDEAVTCKMEACAGGAISELDTAGLAIFADCAAGGSESSGGLVP